MEPALTTAVEIVKSLGFPVLVALWLMFRTDRLLSKLTAAIIELSRVVEHCNRRE